MILKKMSLKLAICVLLLNSCTEDDAVIQSQVIGEWALVSYSIGDSFDINNDGTSNLNLLNEINCANNEVLSFEAIGVVSSNETYNPSILISKFNNDNSFNFNVECPEGTIGFATSFSQINDNTFEFSDRTFTIVDNTFEIVIEDEIEVFNEDFSELLETRDLVLRYTRL